MLIQQMRDGSEGILAKIIIGLIIIVFGLFGFGSITTFLAPVPSVAVVNDAEITQQEMEIAVERNRRLLLGRGVPVDQIDEDQLRENVLQGLISREILSQAAINFDLYFSDAELDNEIIESDVFKVDGVFNPDQFQNVVRSVGFTPLSYRDEMRRDKLFEQMLTGIRESSFVTEAESRRFSSLLSQTRDLAYIRIIVEDLIDEVSVTDDDISDYYTQNSGEFITEESVKLQYLELKHEQLAAEFEVNEEELAQFYRDNLADYSTDESRRVAHILVESSEDLPVEDAQKKALAVYDRIKQGEDFSALAMEVSDDVGSRENGGDLGFNPQGTFFPEFEAVAYDLAMNQVSEPVETEIGFHIIKVLEIEEATVPALEEVRGEVEQLYRLAETEDQFVTTSARLAEMLFESIDLQEPASELGLEVMETEHLSREASHFLMGNSEISAAAFSADVLLDGNNSDLIELTDTHHVGFRVLEHEPSVTRSLAQVAEDIRYILQREKARDLAEQRANGITDAIRSGSLAQFVANEYGFEWTILPGVSRFNREVEPLILREAFKLPRPAEDKESLGVAMLPNGDGLVLRVSAVTNQPLFEIREEELAGVRQSVAAQLGAIDFQEFEDALTGAASVERTN